MSVTLTNHEAAMCSVALDQAVQALEEGERAAARLGVPITWDVTKREMIALKARLEAEASEVAAR